MEGSRKTFGRLGLHMNAKFPRIAHLPWSPGATSDDRRLENVDRFIGRTVLVTEKLDGANVCFTSEQVYARSHSGPPKGPMFDRLKAVHAAMAPRIDGYLSVFCEWCMYVHSTEYEDLPSPPLFVIGIRDDDTRTWWSWKDTNEYANEIGLQVPPLMSEMTVHGDADLRKMVEVCAGRPSSYGKRCEGVVVRVPGPVADEHFGKFFAKHVNAGFVGGTALGAELQEQGLAG